MKQQLAPYAWPTFAIGLVVLLFGAANGTEGPIIIGGLISVVGVILLAITGKVFPGR